MVLNRSKGFTLAELLIALAILGQISAFTIPKVISAQQNASSNSKAKEAAAMISGAFMAYQLNNALSSSITADALTPYMNYVSVDTSNSNQIDDSPSFGASTCNASKPCLRLHNGGVIQYESSSNFGGTANNYVLFYFFDPDGTYSGSAWGTGKALRIAVTYNGRVTSMGQSTVTLCNSLYCLGADPGWDPDWFSW